MAEQNVVDVPAQYASEDFDSGNDFSGDEGGAEGSGQPAPGLGQSKSSRRRRRKRKGKVVGSAPSGAESGAPAAAEDGGGAATPVVMEGESLALAASAPAARRPNLPQQASNNGQTQGQPQGQQGQGQGGKRWKKKFRDRERRQRPETPGGESRENGNGASAGTANGSYAGNGSLHGGGENAYRRDYRPDNFGNLAGGFKRKGKNGSSGGGQGQRKERAGFVGPMDHSYREAEGNGAPPSTIQVNGSHGAGRRGHRHQGDNQPIDRSMPAAIPIPENAQTHIYFFVEDLFITAKVQETARKQGVKVAFLKNEKEAIAELTSGEDTNRPALVVFDLNNANAKPLTLIPKLKTKLKRSASIIGFLSSIQGDLKAKAVEAGCDTVMPRAAFSQNLPNLLRRYGVEEAEEVNYNC